MRRLTEQQRCACSRLLEPEQDAHQGRLPPAVRAGDRNELALAEPEVDVLEDTLPRAIAEGDSLKLDG